jgi:hypothetical protein
LLAPYTPSNRNYSLLEITPISAGVLFSTFSPNDTNRGVISYSDIKGENREEVIVGGMVEPFAFISRCGGINSLSYNISKSSVSLPSLCPLSFIINTTDMAETIVEEEDKTIVNPNFSFFDLPTAIGASSYAPGCDFASSENPIVLKLSAPISYWSPISSSVSQENNKIYNNNAKEFLVADGGGLQIDNLISLVQRKVDKIILFCSSSVTLSPSSEWDPFDESTTLSQNNIDFDIPSFFGVIPTDLSDEELRTYDLSKSQIFSSSEWPSLAASLQKAQSAGKVVVLKDSSDFSFVTFFERV